MKYYTSLAAILRTILRNNLNDDQVKELIHLINACSDGRTIRYIAKPEHSADKMRILIACVNMGLTLPHIKVVASVEGAYRMNLVRWALHDGVELDRMTYLIANSKTDEDYYNNSYVEVKRLRDPHG